MKVKSESEVAQLRPILSNSMDCSPPASVLGIFQARVLEWGAIAFSTGRLVSTKYGNKGEGSKTEETQDPSSQRHTLEKGKQIVNAAAIDNTDRSLTMSQALNISTNICSFVESSQQPLRKVLKLFVVYRLEDGCTEGQ